MPSTVYKGDLTEISFGHETGLELKHNYAGSFTFTHQSTSASADTSTIRLSGGAADTPVESGVLWTLTETSSTTKISFRWTAS